MFKLFEKPEKHWGPHSGPRVWNSCTSDSRVIDDILRRV